MGKRMRKRMASMLLAIAAAIFCASGTSVSVSAAAVNEGKTAQTVLVETGFESGELTPWVSKDGAALSAVADSPHQGNYCMKIAGRSITGAGAKLELNQVLKNNNVLTISAYAKYMEGPETKRILATLYCGGTYYNFAGTTLTKNQWGEVKGSVIIPEQVDLSDSILYFETPWTGEPSVTEDLMDFYVDDIKAVMEPFQDISTYPSLKEGYQDEFFIGVAVPNHVLAANVYSNLVKQQFNSMTMENEMKPGYILDQNTSLSDLGKYREGAALNFDSYKMGLDYAKKNGIKMRGHTLIWHAQTPDWFFYENYDTTGTPAGRELMLKRMENYIKSVIQWTETNYPGVVYAWDVVNEAVADYFGEGPAPLRQENSKWYQTIGEEFVAKAFEYARKYTKQYAPDHSVKLFYNDYNEYFPAKRDGIIELLKPIKAAGNIDGVGMQSHINTEWPLEGDIGYMTAVRKFRDELGLEIHVTELDIGMLPGDTFASQGVYYRNFMEALLKEKKDGANITCVTFWGLTDGLSWRQGENALLFYNDLGRKPAFDGLAAAVLSGSSDIIRNGGIELELEGWESKDGAALELAYGTAHTGSRSLKVTGRTKTSSGAAQEITGKIQPQNTYEVNAAVMYKKSEQDNEVIPAQAEFNLCLFYGDSYKGSDSIQVLASGKVEPDKWDTITGTFTVPEHTDMSKVRFFVETAYKEHPASGDLIRFYLDDVSITAVTEVDQEAANAVRAKIEAIGTVAFTQSCKAMIDAARTAYNKLTTLQKALVTNYSKLTNAEARYTQLKNAAQNVSITKTSIATIKPQNYTGKAVKPPIGVVYAGKKLVKDRDYTITYSNHIKVGTAKVTIAGTGNYTGKVTKTFRITVFKNKTYTAGNYRYKMTNAAVTGKGTVTVTGTVKKTLKSILVPDTVTIGGTRFLVTAVGVSAFKGCNKATTAVIGKNVKTIGGSAFYGCGKLKKITIKSAVLKSVGKNAVKGIHAKAVISCPKKQLSKYKKLINSSAGYKKSMKFSAGK